MRAITSCAAESALVKFCQSGKAIWPSQAAANDAGATRDLVVTEAFLDHFGLESARDLPGLKELRAAGLLDNRPLPGSLALPGEEDDEPVTGQTELFED